MVHGARCENKHVSMQVINHTGLHDQVTLIDLFIPDTNSGQADTVQDSPMVVASLGKPEQEGLKEDASQEMQEGEVCIVGYTMKLNKP